MEDQQEDGGSAWCKRPRAVAARSAEMSDQNRRFESRGKRTEARQQLRVAAGVLHRGRNQGHMQRRNNSNRYAAALLTRPR